MSSTREATRQFRIQQWTKIIQDRQQSGLTVNEYCKNNNITRDAYFYWLRIVKENALKSLPAERFVELPVSQDPYEIDQNVPSCSCELKLQIRDFSITVTEATSSSLLARTLEVIRNVI